MVAYLRLASFSFVVAIAAATGTHAQAPTSANPPVFETKRFTQSGAAGPNQTVRACVASGYKLVGGGAAAQNRVLRTSYPQGPAAGGCWVASTLHPDTLTVTAIGVYDPGNVWDVRIVSGSDMSSVATATLPAGYALTGGGGQIANVPDTCCGLYVSGPRSADTWEAHYSGTMRAQITSHVIGIRRTDGGSVKSTIVSVQGDRPSSQAALPIAYTLTGGGVLGDGVRASVPGTLAPGRHTWTASVGQLPVRVYAIGVQSYPPQVAPFESWKPTTDAFWQWIMNPKPPEEPLPDRVKAACASAGQSPTALTSTGGTAPAPVTFSANYSSASGLAPATNTGHSYDVNLQSAGKCGGNLPARTVTLGGVTYQLAGYHFHHPSEHVLDGMRYPAELHIVHVNNDTTPPRRLVLGVLLQPPQTPRHIANDNFAPLLVAKDTAEGAPAVCVAAINPVVLLPEDRTNRQYDGSLTTPPCDSGVKWVVYTTPVTVPARVFDMISTRKPNSYSARPLQTRAATSR